MAIGRVNDLDLVALSNIAWEIIDPDFEGDEKAWVAGLHEQWRPVADAAKLRARLDELVDTMVPAPPDPPSP